MRVQKYALVLMLIQGSYSFVTQNGSLTLERQQKRRTNRFNYKSYYHTTKPPVNHIPTTTPHLQAQYSALALPTLHRDNSYCLCFLFILANMGISLERHTTIGKALSAPLTTMAIALVFANVGILPFTSPVYQAVNTLAVPFAVPLLLFDSDLQRVVRDTGSLLVAFVLGALATVAGTLVALAALPSTPIGCACALAARHIGGAINFVAVAETLKLSPTTVSAAIAADNLVVAAYFCVLFMLAKEEPEEPSPASGIGDQDGALAPEDASPSITLATMASSMATAAALVTTGKLMTKIILPTGTSALPLTSVLTVVAATMFTRHFTPIRSTGSALGVLLVQLFFAASGAAGSIRLVLQRAPLLLAFSSLQILIHFVVLMGLGRCWMLRCPPNELYLASNANVGGPTTAAAMAQAKGWKKLVLPALLIGILGYSTATPIALALAPVLRMIVAAAGR